VKTSTKGGCASSSPTFPLVSDMMAASVGSLRLVLVLLRVIAKTLVSTLSQHGQAESSVVTRVLIVVAQAIHVLVSPLAIANTASERTKSLLGLPFDLPKLTLRDIPKIAVCRVDNVVR